MKKTTLLLMLVFLSFNFIDAQNKNANNFNLPPGCVLKQKFKFYDLSFKIDGKINEYNYSDSDILVVKNIPVNELENFKSTDLEYYNYYMKGLSFLDGLSLRVKQIYTINELWYIYVFDQELKNRLLIIK